MTDLVDSRRSGRNARRRRSDHLRRRRRRRRRRQEEDYDISMTMTTVAGGVAPSRARIDIRKRPRVLLRAIIRLGNKSRMSSVCRLLRERAY